MSELWQLAAVDGAREIAAGRLSAADWMEAVLARIAEADPLIHAFVTLIPRAQLLNEARMATQRIRREGRRSPIDGAPLGLKDCIDVAGVTTTGSSRLFADAPPAAGDAPLVRRARDAGALIFGKQTLYELSYGGPSFDLPAPPARNPWNLAHIPGGSSSGSAAAVAAGCGLLAVGTDAGGSIRQPASFCGLVGLKPTGGAISTQGILPMSQTLGDAGPLARSIADASALFDALSGAATYAAVNQPLGSPRIAALDAFIAYAEPVVQQAIEHAMVALTKAGAVKTTLANPPDPLMLDSVGRTILLGEAYATHETQLQTNPSIYGAIARHRFSLGAFLSAADMIQAQRQRARLTAALNDNLDEADILIAPGEANSAPRFEDAGESFPFTSTPSLRIGFNLTGHPALVVPAGFDAQGLPVAVQLVAKAGREDLLFAAGRIIERQAGVIDTWPAFTRA